MLLAPSVWTQAPAQPDAKQPAALDARDAQGLTPLIVAASAGQADTVRALLAQGAAINATSADGRTALIAAVQNNRIEAVQALIAAGANLNAATRGTGTALNVAENKGETQIAALLLAVGARSTGKSQGDTVCVRPWSGDGFCGTVNSFSIPSVEIQVTRIVGCANGCAARKECSASRPVGGADGLQAGNQIAVPSWCLTQTGVKP
jgi:ankyrin repeat protein